MFEKIMSLGKVKGLFSKHEKGTFNLKNEILPTIFYRDEKSADKDIIKANKTIDKLLNKYDATKTLDEKISILFEEKETIRYVFDFFYKITKYMEYFGSQLVISEEDKKFYMLVEVAQERIIDVECMVVQILLDVAKVSDVPKEAYVKFEEKDTSFGFNVSQDEKEKIEEDEKTLRGVILNDNTKDLFLKLEMNLPCFYKEFKIARMLLNNNEGTDKFKKIFNLILNRAEAEDNLENSFALKDKIKQLNNILYCNKEIINFMGYENKFKREEAEGYNIELMQELYRQLYNNFELKTDKYDDYFESGKGTKMYKKDLEKLIKDTILEYYGKEYLDIVEEAFNKNLVVNDLKSPYLEYARTIGIIHCRDLNRLDNARTLIHELGHYVEQVLELKDDVSLLKFDSLGIEIPSLVNELMFLNHILDNVQKDDKLISEIKIYIYVLVNITTYHLYLTFSEDAIVKHAAVSKDKEVEINEDKINALDDKFGFTTLINDNTIKYDKIDYYYARYIYGQLIAVRILNNIKKDKTYMNKYIGFLKVREKLDMQEALNYLGIDAKDFTLIDDYIELINKLISIVGDK